MDARKNGFQARRRGTDAVIDSESLMGAAGNRQSRLESGVFRATKLREQRLLSHIAARCRFSLEDCDTLEDQTVSI